MSIPGNLTLVRERIYRAALRAGRDPGEIKLVAVTKNVPVEVIKEALACGINCLGENRAQEFREKSPLLPPDLEWHFIGHLQTNKVKMIVGKVDLIHSLDSWPLAQELNKAALEAGVVVRVLMQVNVSGEQTKYGLSITEAEDFAWEVFRLPGLELRGLMTIAPLCMDPEEVRPVFKKARELALHINNKVRGLKMDDLSMGMSGDFEVALEEGANILRLGTAIFCKRY